MAAGAPGPDVDPDARSAGAACSTLVAVRRRCSTLALALLVASSAFACASEDGRTLAPPEPGQTTTTSTGDVIGSPAPDGEGGQELFSLFSTELGDGGPIPERFTCRGEGISPPLDWVAAPPASELALVVRDRDAGGFVHWVVTGIDPVVIGIGAGGLPEGAVEAPNSAGSPGWTPPCPPEGSGPHTYAFTLHALPEPLVVDPTMAADDAAAMVEGASTAQATLSGVVTASV